MAGHKQNKMPKPIQISRKLTLASEQIAVMSPSAEEPAAIRCTFVRTGCAAHTC